MPKNAAAAITVALAAPAIAHADVANGSFESSYQGWTLAKETQSASFATAAIVQSGQMIAMGGSLLDYVDHMSVANYSPGLPLRVEPTDGSWQAILLQNGPSTTRLSQVVTLPAHPQLTFDVGYHNWESSFSANQTFRVQILDADTSAVLATVLETKNSSDMAMAMSHQTFGLEAFANMSVRVQFEVIAQKNFLDVQLDNVHVTDVANEDGAHCAACNPQFPDETQPDPTVVDDRDLTGGCSTGNGGATAFAALALLAVRRRRAR